MVESLKINLRNQVLNKKNLYIRTKRNTIAIDTAVDKAVYIVNGGTKLIILPPYCDIVTLISMDILKLMNKQFDFENNLEKAIDYMNKNFSSIQRVTLSDDGDIEIRMNEQDVLKIGSEERFDTDMLLNIACVILVRNSNVQYSKSEVLQFRQSLNRVIHYDYETEGELCTSME